MKKILMLISFILLFGCLGIPEKVTPVENFEMEKYLGKWYEIARLDHSFERGLTNVTAEYTLKEDGGIYVKNSGFSSEDNEWSEAEGKAYFVDDSNIGYLKVSFFGPFYGSYIVFDLNNQNYQHAFISGPDLSYLWLLSRTPTISDSLLNRFLEKSKKIGFDTKKIIIVDQTKNSAKAL